MIRYCYGSKIRSCSTVKHRNTKPLKPQLTCARAKAKRPRPSSVKPIYTQQQPEPRTAPGLCHSLGAWLLSSWPRQDLRNRSFYYLRRLGIQKLMRVLFVEDDHNEDPVMWVSDSAPGFGVVTVGQYSEGISQAPETTVRKWPEHQGEGVACSVRFSASRCRLS